MGTVDYDKRHAKGLPIGNVRLPVSKEPACQLCGRPLNPVDRMLGTVCGQCVRENHQALAA